MESKPYLQRLHRRFQRNFRDTYVVVMVNPEAFFSPHTEDGPAEEYILNNRILIKEIYHNDELMFRIFLFK